MMNFISLLLLLFSTSLFAQTSFTQTNLLNNPGFENGKARWTASGGSFTISSSSPYKGTNSASFDASSSSQTLKSTLVAVGAGNETRACMGGIWYKADSITAGDYNLKVEDSSSVMLNGPTALDFTPTNGAWRLAFVSFICPSAATTIRLVVASAVSNPVAISLDDAWLGEPNNQMTAADPVEVVAHAYFATTGSCSWSRTNTALGAFSTSASCPAITVDISSPTVAIDAADTDLPQIKFSSLPSGIYEVTASFSNEQTGGTTTAFAINDGTTSKGNLSHQSAAVEYSSTITATFSHSGGAKTFALYGSNTAGSVIVDANAANQRLTWTVKRYPSSSTSKVTLETQGWNVNANITGANPALGVLDVASYTEISDAGLTMTLASGSATAKVPCSTTNPPTGLTCAAGNESVGVVFTPPYTGNFQVCATFSVLSQGDAADVEKATFQLVETPTSAQTVTTNANERAYFEHTFGSSNETIAVPMKVCGLFNFTSVTEKAIRLFYVQDQTNTPDGTEIEANGILGSNDINFKVVPFTQNFPQAVALADLPIPTTLSDASATRWGVKAYAHGGSYNGGLAPTVTLSAGGGTLSSVQLANFFPYQTQDGSWRMKFNLRVTLSSTARTNVTLAVAGVTFKNIGGNGEQAVTAFGVSVPMAEVFAVDNTGTISLNHVSATNTKYGASGDVALDSKPTWAY